MRSGFASAIRPLLKKSGKRRPVIASSPSRRSDPAFFAAPNWIASPKRARNDDGAGSCIRPPPIQPPRSAPTSLSSCPTGYPRRRRRLTQDRSAFSTARWLPGYERRPAGRRPPTVRLWSERNRHSRCVGLDGAFSDIREDHVASPRQKRPVLHGSPPWVSKRAR